MPSRSLRRMRPAVILTLCLFAPAAFASGRNGPELRTGTIVRDADGVLRDGWGLSLRTTPEALIAPGAVLFPADAPELREIGRKESLTGTHVRYAQSIGGVDVLGAGLTIDTDRAGVVTGIHDRTVRGARILPPIRTGERDARRLAASSLGAADAEAAGRVAFLEDGSLRSGWRVVVRPRPSEPFAVLVDGTSGEVVRTEPLFLNASARIFTSNPVEALGDPSLQDLDDSPSAVPGAAYALAELPGVGTSLSGPNANIVDIEAPHSSPADPTLLASLDRGDDAFEEAMAYYHVDRSQSYLQSLGYTGARRIVSLPIDIDAHAGGADNSFFVPLAPGRGRLQFGDGGVDDAEDPDILLHEYAHAIQEAIAPSTFTGPYRGQPRALGEGFGDYWAFSAAYEGSLAGGRDPFCVGDWDARCAGGPSSGCGYAAGADCLRRVDSTKTMSDYIDADQKGTEHRNGEIWSSALREIFMALAAKHGPADGRMLSDRIVLESHYGAPPEPQFSTIARKMIEADQLLAAGSDVAILCAAFTARGILEPADCAPALRGEVTIYEGTQRDLPIPDADFTGLTSYRFVEDPRPVERVQVRVDIEHPFRGDLRIVLEAPDGRTVMLESPNRAAGSGIRTTYGLDAEPAEPLSTLSGMPAAGRWALHVIDTATPDQGRLVSWALLLRLSGDHPLAERNAVAPSAVIPAAARLSGAQGTEFITDVRIFNPSDREIATTAYFTPSGSDGRTDFAAMRISVAPGQTAVLDDVVTSWLRTTGAGTLQLSPGGDLVVSSRTYNRAASGTFGQFIPQVDAGQLTAAGEATLMIPQLRNDAAFRTNVGLAETAGGIGTVEVTIFGSDGAELSSSELTILPFSHLQFPALGGIGGTTSRSARAVVRVKDGNARIAAYASVIDNASGDPIYVPGIRQTSGSVTRRVPAIYRGEGALGTHWRSDLWLTNGAPAHQAARCTLLSQSGQRVPAGTLELAPGESRALDDFISTEFGLASASGSLECSSDASILVTLRSWTAGEAGSYGQYVPARDVGDAIRLGAGETLATQVDVSSEFRTNAGLTEIGGAGAVVRVRLFDASGMERWTRDVGVAPDGQLQLALREEGAPEVTGGRVAFRVISGEGQILAYASVIDNRSGDPIYVPAKAVTSDER